MSSSDDRPLSEQTRYEQTQVSPEFALLRSRLRRFVFPMSAFFLLWYLAYVLLASYQKDFMATRLPAGSNLTVGLYIGLLQFVTTFAITTWYVWFAGRKLDPSAELLCAEIEGGR